MTVRIKFSDEYEVKVGDLVLFGDVIILITGLFLPNIRGVPIYKDGTIGLEDPYILSKCVPFSGTVTISNK